MPDAKGVLTGQEGKVREHGTGRHRPDRAGAQFAQTVLGLFRQLERVLDQIGIAQRAGVADLVEVGFDPVAVDRGLKRQLVIAFAQIDAAPKDRLCARLVGPERVQDVADKVLGGEFPVTVDLGLDRAADEFGAALVIVQHDVEIIGKVAKELEERDRIGVEGAENQALIAVDLGHRRQADLRFFERLVFFIDLAIGAAQRAVDAKGPAVIVADEPAGLFTGVHHADAVATVRARVQERVDRAVALTHDDDVVFAHRGAHEVARIGDLAFMGQKQPRAGKDLAQLGLIDLFVGKHTAVNLCVLAVHQFGKIGIAAGLRVDRFHVRAAFCGAFAVTFTHWHCLRSAGQRPFRRGPRI